MSSDPRTPNQVPRAANASPRAADRTATPMPTDTTTTTTETYTDPPPVGNPASSTARAVYETRPAVDPVPAAAYAAPVVQPRRPVEEVESNVNVVTPRDRVRWGPILAGLLSALATFAILSLLGAAIGVTTLYANGGTAPNGTPADQFGGTAGIWGAVSALIAFFLGGFIAAKTSAVGGRGNGWINGTMVFLSGLVLISFLAAQGVGNLFGALGVNLSDLRILGSNTFSDPAARAAALDNAKNGLWWSLASVLVGLIAAGLGGVVGARTAHEVWHSDAEARF